jgi:hypothetical protein
MSRKQHYTKPVVVPAATIDLHGYKRDEGIAAVTAFVESSQRQFPPPTDAWVCIITGSGHHSPSGPVLRDAVRSLLNKREMEYTLQRGKGSFLVNVHSGHALVAAPALAECTKIQIVANNTKNNNDNNAHSHVKLVNRPAISSNSTNATSRSIETTTTSVVAPKPAQVVADDVLVERVKQESHRQFVALQKRRRDEMQLQLKQALAASKREMEQQQAQREQEWWCLAAILKQSSQQQQQEELLRAQEQERLEEILRHSKEEEERMQRLEQEQLNEILRISQQQQQQEEEENSQDELERVLLSLSQLQIHNNDDDEQLKNQALQQSLHDVHAADDEFHKALSLSLQECNQDESVSIHNKASSALELSIITESTTIEMLQEQVGYVIEEVD